MPFYLNLYFFALPSVPGKIDHSKFSHLLLGHLPKHVLLKNFHQFVCVNLMYYFFSLFHFVTKRLSSFLPAFSSTIVSWISFFLFLFIYCTIGYSIHKKVTGYGRNNCIEWGLSFSHFQFCSQMDIHVKRETMKAGMTWKCFKSNQFYISDVLIDVFVCIYIEFLIVLQNNKMFFKHKLKKKIGKWILFKAFSSIDYS